VAAVGKRDLEDARLLMHFDIGRERGLCRQACHACTLAERNALVGVSDF
jgi:hypothetical protein